MALEIIKSSYMEKLDQQQNENTKVAAALKEEEKASLQKRKGASWSGYLLTAERETDHFHHKYTNPDPPQL